MYKEIKNIQERLETVDVPNVSHTERSAAGRTSAGSLVYGDGATALFLPYGNQW